jgi:hypothetical protein
MKVEETTATAMRMRGMPGNQSHPSDRRVDSVAV